MNIKKVLAVLLSMAMLFTTAVTAIPEINTDKAFVETTFPRQNSSSGTCGDDLVWMLDDNGTLTISGTGAMTNYSSWSSSSAVPWYDNRKNIKKIIIEDGVTSIGDYAFYDCSSLTSVTIPDSVTSIGDDAFYSCESLTSITIPDSVTSIGDYAFSYCSSLTSVTIPDSVTSIGDSAFYDCSSLTSVTIPDSVTSIGDGAFYGCESLTSVTIPDSVTSIGDYAFAWCENLTSVTIPDSVTSIGDYAFCNCESLTSVTIPDSVTSIGYRAFSGCSSLTSITVDENNNYYSNDECGVLFNKDKTTLIQYPIGNERTSYVIPDSVTTIGEYAFRNCESLTSVTIPDSVTSIGEWAFYNCDSLTSVTIPDSVTSIDDYAFYHCSSLTSVTIPDSVTSIGDYAFRNCESLTSVTIPDSVTSIGEWAFAYCSSLTSVTIPDSVTSIGDDSFYDCSNLADVYYAGSEEDWNKISIGSSNDPLINANIHFEKAECEHVYGEWETTVEPGCETEGEKQKECSSCGDVVTEVIPANGHSIKETVVAPTCTEEGYTHHYCENCAYAYDDTYAGALGHSYGEWIKNNEGMYERTCTACGNVETKAIPIISSGVCGENLTWTLDDEGTLTISGTGDMTNYSSSSDVPWYSNRSSIKKVIIENGVTSIGDRAFYYCGSLASVTIPDSVTSIGNRAFYDCSSLTSITVDENNNYYSNDEYGVLFNKDKTTLIQYPIGNERTSYVIPDSVTSIGDYAFAWCENLTSVTIGDSVTSIGDYAFYYCSSLTSVTIPDSVTSIGKRAFSGCSSLASVTIPDSVTSIGDNAFSFCNSLTSVTIPDSVTSIGYRAFYDCSSLTSIAVDENNNYYSNDEYGVLFNKDKTTLIQYPIGNERTSYVIPDSVTTIGDSAFYNCYNLTSVTIGDSVTTIGDSAFYNCYSLTSVTIPDGVTSIGNYAFCYCSSLASVTIPDSVTSIGGYAFAWCENLTSVTIGDSVTSIGDDAFYSCDSLTSVTISDSVTSIGDDAFAWCENLTSVTIGDSVTSIGYGAFESCESLTSVTIPNSVTRIGEWAFYDCSSLADVYYGGSELDWEKISIGSYNDPLINANIHFEKAECEHVYGEWETTVEHGCETEGEKQKECSSCGDVVTEVIPANGHSIKETVVAPTCTEEGYTHHYCENCTYTYDDTYVDATGHSMKFNVIAPNCTDEGYTHHYCENCNYKYDDEFVPANGHSMKYDVITPTCTGEGYTHHYCENCTYTYNDTYVVANGHSMKCDVIIPTCTKDGYTHHYCENCTYEFDDEHITAPGHSMKKTVVSPTCTAGGYTHHYCENCSHAYNDSYTKERGHAFGEWITDKEANVFEDGLRHRLCTRCPEKETENVPFVIEDHNRYGVANFKIVNAQTLTPIKDACIAIELNEIGSKVFKTDANGEVSITLPVGKLTVSAYAKGCLTRNLMVNVYSGENNMPVIGLSSKPTYEATLESHRMTEEEIKDAGIDIYAPENTHIFEYELKINFEADVDAELPIPEFKFYFPAIIPGGNDTDDGDDNPNPDTDDDGDDDGDEKVNPKPVYAEGPDPDYVWNPDRGCLENEKNNIEIYPVKEYMYLIVRGGVSWTKEMFDVEMLIVNNSSTDILQDLDAELILPEGLSLPETSEGQQEKIHIDEIDHNSSEVIHWYVRGDRQGQYPLQATLTGKIMPFDEEINETFTAKNCINVLAGGALHLDFAIPNTAYKAEDYPIRVTLTNVSDFPLYNVRHFLDYVEQGMIVYYSDGHSNSKIDPTNIDAEGVLPTMMPGDKIIIEMSVNIFFESAIIKYKADKMKEVVEIVKALDMAKSIYDTVTCVIGLARGGVEALEAITDLPWDKVAVCAETIAAVKGIEVLLRSSAGELTVDALKYIRDSGVEAFLEEIKNDPMKWLENNMDSQVKLQMILDATDYVKKSLARSRFDIYDSINTALSNIPVRFLVSSFAILEDGGNTTHIPYSISSYSTGEHYYGISNVNKYYSALGKMLMEKLVDEELPVGLQFIFGTDELLDVDESIAFINATEKELEIFRTKSSTGDVKFTVSIISNSLKRSVQPSFTISTDDENAVYNEDGSVTVSGNSMIYLMPENLNGGTLHVTDSLGNVYEYVIDVVPAHECCEDKREVLLTPTKDDDGFAVYCCGVCGEAMRVETLESEDLCSNHTLGGWIKNDSESVEGYNVYERKCSECEHSELRIVSTETNPAPVVPELTKDSKYTVNEEYDVIFVAMSTANGESTSSFMSNIATNEVYVQIVDKSGALQTSVSRLTSDYSVQILDEDGNVTKTYGIVILGDHDNNGRLTFSDVSAIETAAVSKPKKGTVDFVKADIDGNERLSMSDASLLEVFIVSGTW